MSDLSLICPHCGSSETEAGASGTLWCTACDAIVQSDDQSDFRRLDAVVKAGLDTFVRVGEALREIRDRKLYRIEHKTFQAYCQDRHKISGRRAYQLIDAATIAENVNPGSQTLPSLTSEKHARELAKIEPARGST